MSLRVVSRQLRALPGPPVHLLRHLVEDPALIKNGPGRRKPTPPRAGWVRKAGLTVEEFVAAAE
jgi:hypothetical protein